MHKYTFDLINEGCHVAPLTLIYPAHFEDVQCQSGVNHIYEG